MAKIQDELLVTIREIVTESGAEYAGVRGDSVVLRDPETGASCSLYIFACNRENVRLALKALREPPIPEFQPLEKAEAL